MASSYTIQYAPQPTTAAGAAAPGAPGFNINPAPQGGQGAYGAVPGAIGLPSPAADLGAVYPNLSGSTGKVSGDIMSELRGELSPETQNNIANTAASFGVSSGMPLSGLARNKQLESLGLTTEQLQHQGIGDFLSATPVVSKTQTVTPELQSEIASRNALFGSAPSPGAAAGEQQSLFQQELDAMRQPQGGRPGGFSSFSAPTPGQGNPPNIPAGGPPGVVGPFGPSGNVTGGFSTPAGNPFALQPTGDLFGGSGATGGNVNPYTGGALTPADLATMQGITPGSQEWNDSFQPAGRGAPTDYTNSPGNPVNDLAAVYGSTAQPTSGNQWDTDMSGSYPGQ